MTNTSDRGTTLTLHDAANLLSGGGMSTHDAEVLLANAIQQCELHANVKRWATEQWDGPPAGQHQPARDPHRTQRSGRLAQRPLKHSLAKFSKLTSLRPCRTSTMSISRPTP